MPPLRRREGKQLSDKLTKAQKRRERAKRSLLTAWTASGFSLRVCPRGSVATSPSRADPQVKEENEKEEIEEHVKTEGNGDVRGGARASGSA